MGTALRHGPNRQPLAMVERSHVVRCGPMGAVHLEGMCTWHAGESAFVVFVLEACGWGRPCPGTLLLNTSVCVVK